MKVLLLLAATVGLSCAYNYNETSEIRSRDLSCNCGWRNAGRIVGGKETRKNEYPWMVSLNIGCGGSIISPWHILTAAHCTASTTASQIIASVGRHHLHNDKNSVEYKVSKIIQHEAYDSRKLLNDIAILVTDKPIQYNQEIGPVCLWKKGINLVGEYVKVMGWGLTKGTGDGNYLREVDVAVIPLDKCKEHWGNVDLSGTQLCAYEDGKDSCNGDSGGPLVYMDPETNRYTQVALVSFGAGECGSSPAPSGNTHVPKYYDWISKAISSSKPGAKICTKN